MNEDDFFEMAANLNYMFERVGEEVLNGYAACLIGKRSFEFKIF